MGKIRQHLEKTTVVGLAQWVGRKVRNHDPLSTVDGPGSAIRKKYRTITDGVLKPKTAYVGLDSLDPSVVLYGLEDGRVFKITVTELAENEGNEAQITSVGA